MFCLKVKAENCDSFFPSSRYEDSHNIIISNLVLTQFYSCNELLWPFLLTLKILEVNPGNGRTKRQSGSNPGRGLLIRLGYYPPICDNIAQFKVIYYVMDVAIGCRMNTLIIRMRKFKPRGKWNPFSELVVGQKYGFCFSINKRSIIKVMSSANENQQHIKIG